MIAVNSVMIVMSDPMLGRSDLSCLGPLLDPLIERLQNSRIHCRDHVNRRIQLLLRHSRFPCVRKAPIHSGIAEPHHRHGKTDEHLLALGQTLDRMRIAVKSSEVGFLHGRRSSGFAVYSLVSRVSSFPDNARPETPNSRLRIYAGFTPVISA